MELEDIETQKPEKYQVTMIEWNIKNLLENDKLLQEGKSD